MPNKLTDALLAAIIVVTWFTAMTILIGFLGFNGAATKVSALASLAAAIWLGMQNARKHADADAVLERFHKEKAPELRSSEAEEIL